MKKLIQIISTIAVLSSSQSFAQTQGNYIEVDISRNYSLNKYQISGNSVSNYKDFRNSGSGYGASYKYAFNRDKIFFAPGVFFDKLGLEAKDRNQNIISSDYRYGLKLEIGYDFSDKIAAYMTNGVANVDYKVDWRSVGKVKSGSKLGHFIGFGSIYKISGDVALNIEYNLQSLVFDTPDNSDINQVKSNISVIKVGASYGF